MVFERSRPGFANSYVLAHEIVEWLMDPIAANVVPTWNDPLTPNLCWNPLIEVADPLDDLDGQALVFNNRSYTIPDVVFLQWFARTSAKDSVNGWYSMRNALASASGKCPFAEYIETFYFPNDVGMTESYLTSFNDHKQPTGWLVQFGQVVTPASTIPCRSPAGTSRAPTSAASSARPV